jgi:hypothetical protein
MRVVLLPSSPSVLLRKSGASGRTSEGAADGWHGSSCNRRRTAANECTHEVRVSGKRRLTLCEHIRSERFQLRPPLKLIVSHSKGAASQSQPQLAELGANALFDHLRAHASRRESPAGGCLPAAHARASHACGSRSLRVTIPTTWPRAPSTTRCRRLSDRNISSATPADIAARRAGPHVSLPRAARGSKTRLPNRCARNR